MPDPSPGLRLGVPAPRESDGDRSVTKGSVEDIWIPAATEEVNSPKPVPALRVLPAAQFRQPRKTRHFKLPGYWPEALMMVFMAFLGLGAFIRLGGWRLVLVLCILVFSSLLLAKPGFSERIGKAVSAAFAKARQVHRPTRTEGES